MSKQIIFHGVRLVQAGAASFVDASLFSSTNPGNKGTVAVLGEADGGEPNNILGFTDPTIMEKYFRGGPLANAARLAFQPFKSQPDGTTPGGAQTVLVYKVNASTPAAATLKGAPQDGSGVVTTSPGPWDFRSLSSLTSVLDFTVDAGGDITADLTATAAAATGAAATFAAGAATDQLVFSVIDEDGTIVVTVDLSSSGLNTEALYITAINNAILAAGARAVAEDNGSGQITIVCTQKGTGGHVNVTNVGGHAAKHGFSVANHVGTGDVANLRQVTAAELITKLGSPAGCTLSDVSGALRIKSSSKGAGSSIEIKTASTAKTVLGLTAGVYSGDDQVDVLTLTTRDYGQHVNNVLASVATNGAGRAITLQFLDGQATYSETIRTTATPKFSVYYTGVGTSPKITITDETLTTSMSVTADQLNLDLTQYKTIADLVAAINAFNVAGTAKYVATVTSYKDQFKFQAATLDTYAALTLGTSLGGATSIYGTLQDCINAINDQSTLVTAAVATGATQFVQPDATSTNVAFTGGTAGSSTNADWSAGFEMFKEVDIATITAAESQDGSEGDYGSTHTIASILQLGDNHAAFMSATGTDKSERTFYGAFSGTKNQIIAQVGVLNSYHSMLFAQRVTSLDRDANLTVFDEWMLALIAASGREGLEDGEPLTAKYINVTDVTQDASWNPRNDGDDMILAGVCIVKKTKKGVKFAKGNTTYTKTDNDAYTEESIVTNWKSMVKDLRETLEDAIEGKRGTVSNVKSLKQIAEARLEDFRTAKRIVDDVVEGQTTKYAYRNVKVRLTKDATFIGATITPVPGVNFVLPEIQLAPANISV